MGLQREEKMLFEVIWGLGATSNLTVILKLN